MKGLMHTCPGCGITRYVLRPGLCMSCSHRSDEATVAPDWTGAKCHATRDDDPWFPIVEPGRRADTVDWNTPRKACMACPLLEACGEWALSDPDPTFGHGMWGGMNPDEREHARALMREPSAPAPRRPNPPTHHKRCGTYSGCSRHRRLNEAYCDPCKDAKNAYERDRKARMRADREELSA